MTRVLNIIDPPERKATADLFTTWWDMHEAHLECADQPPFDDGEVILHFSGSGASCMVFAKDIRLACKIIKAAKKAAEMLRREPSSCYDFLADELEGKS